MSIDRTAPTHRIRFATERIQRPRRVLLRVLDGPGSPRTIELEGDNLKVGRSQHADLQIANSAISSLHFELRATVKGVEVRDLGSTNGLWFSKRRVSSVTLEPGDEFRAGDCRMVLEAYEEVEVELLDTPKYGVMRGSSSVMRELYSQLDSLGPTPLSVLLQGETGTGKGLAARALHELSRRRGKLVTLDCAGLPSTLAEAHLFGVRKGAFTNAEEDRVGVFEAAHGGTLFIDEIGELPLELQLKLLKALDDGMVTRVGEATPSREVEVRVVAATHRDLRSAVIEGRFREDLYYRLVQSRVHVPPLRERGEDIVMLAQHFIDQVGRELDVAIELDEDAAAALRAHSWPGNVRELHNVARMAAYTRKGEGIGAAELRLHDAPRRSEGLEDMLLAGANYAELIEHLERVALSHLHQLHAGNRSRIAEALEIDRSTVQRKLRKLGL